MSDELHNTRQAALLVAIDDVAGNAFRHWLHKLGCAVTWASDPDEALEQAEVNAFALVVLEHRGDELDGVDLTREVKERSPASEVVVFGQDGSFHTAVQAGRLGASDYLCKPLEQWRESFKSLARALKSHDDQLSAARLAREMERHGWLSELVDRLPQGVIIVDRHCRVLMTNRRAQRLLDARDGVAVGEAGHLQVADSGDDDLLQQIVTGAAPLSESSAQPTGGAMHLGRGTGRSSLSLLMLPLDLSAAGGLSRRPVVAVLVSDPDRRLEPTDRMLGRLYGLTPAEARLAAVMMQGKSLEQAAEELGITRSTARDRLKAVFSKTNTRRQGELISLLLSGPALLRLDKALTDDEEEPDDDAADEPDDHTDDEDGDEQ